MTDAFEAIFHVIREHYAKHERACVVLHDDAGRYYLGTHQLRPKDGYRLWFGGVEIKKNYVSAHVMPVYVYPEMIAALSTPLRRRMQGKSCFNFKVLDDALLAELGTLIDMGAARFMQDGALRPPSS